MKCQTLDECVPHVAAKDTVVAAHAWKAETKGRFSDEFDLGEEDVNSVRNGTFVTKGIATAFDDQQVCFLCNTLEKKLCLEVAAYVSSFSGATKKT